MEVLRQPRRMHRTRAGRTRTGAEPAGVLETECSAREVTLEGLSEAEDKTASVSMVTPPQPSPPPREDSPETRGHPPMSCLHCPLVLGWQAVGPEDRAKVWRGSSLPGAEQGLHRHQC